jgi:hypothetical protein
MKLHLQEQLQQRGAADQKAKFSPFDPGLRIRHYELALDEKLAQGRFGTVYRGRWQDQTIAVR